MSRYARMIFMAVSALWGGMCNASVKLPRQLHGFFHPSQNKPKRYIKMLVASRAIKPTCNFCLLQKKQNAAIASSRIPTINKRFRNWIRRRGSGYSKRWALPPALMIFAAPVIVSKAPPEHTKKIVNLFIQSTEIDLFLQLYALQFTHDCGTVPITVIGCTQPMPPAVYCSLVQTSQ
jgi:hypothetical protein